MVPVTTFGLSSHGQALSLMDGGLGTTPQRLGRGCRWGPSRHTASFTDGQSLAAGSEHHAASVSPSPHWSIMESLQCHRQDLGFWPDAMYYLLLNFSMWQDITALFKHSGYPSSRFSAPVSADVEQL